MQTFRRLITSSELLSPGKQTIGPLSVTCCKSSLAVHTNVSLKCNFHTSAISRDVETGLKAVGGGLAMIGAVGPGIGIGSIYGQLLAGVARNPSTKDQLFTMAIMGTVFCETVCLFCFLISILIVYS